MYREEAEEAPKEKAKGRSKARRPMKTSSPNTFMVIAAVLVIAALVSLAAYSLLTTDDEDEPYDNLEFSGEKAYEHVEWQCDAGFRTPNTSAQRAVAQEIKDTMKGYGYRTRYQNFTGWYGDWDGTPFSNVIAWKESRDTGDPTILLIAHYDTRPYSDRNAKQPPGKRPTDHEDYYKPIVGANDGASGVAVLLELGRVLKDEDLPFTIKFLFTDGEDSGPAASSMFYGSRYYAENLDPLEVEEIAHVIVVDMVGDAELRIPRELYSMESDEELMDIIWSNAEKLGVKQFVDEDGQYIGDDHNPFIDRGIPAIDLIDFQYPDETENYWHTQEDTPDKVSGKSLEAVGRVLEYTLKRLKP